MTSRSDPQHLYAEYAKKVHRYLFLRTGDEELSADLTQECFARLIKQSRQQTITHPLPYLYTLAGRLLVDYRRRHETWRTGELDDDTLGSLVDDAARPDLLYEAQRKMATLEAALQRLPERSRQVFLLCRLQEHTYDSAARHLNISSSSVQKHLALALRYLIDQTNPHD
ncbi:RNA polymerase sigma factor [Alloalcanivorax mobilis]|uniref:RNA polymerase sigma factor n=1 Tax=Alloalcanivorax mobilis TaxID=2019569 RepID=UPI000C7764C5|nr:RNA polymerase sigma factor [Alloalcanivorax mobilis]